MSNKGQRKGKADARREHKQEVRAQKEQELKRYQRQQVARKSAIGVVLVAVLLGGIFLVKNLSSGGSKSSAAPSPVGDVAQALKEAGCGSIENVGPFNPSTEDGSHSGLQPLDQYPSIPPASGPHVDATVSAGFYDEPVDLAGALHSLEHGGAEIWYAPSVAKSKEIGKIADFIDATPENTDHTVASPYYYPDEGTYGELPAGNTMALVGWHYRLLCKQPSLAVVQDFLSKYRYPPLGDSAYLGEAPEQDVPI